MTRSSLDKMLADAQSRALEIGDEIEAIGQVAENDGRDLSDDESETITALSAESDAILKKIPQWQAAIDQRNKIRAAKVAPAVGGTSELINPAASDEPPRELVPARVKRQRSRFFDSTAECFAMGQWLGAISGNFRCRQWCSDRNIGSWRGDMSGGTDNAGGYTVPDPLAATILMLIEQYAVFRRYARTAIMTSDTLRVPKYDDTQGFDPGGVGLTVYYPGENTAITASDLVFDQVSLTAVKYATLSLMSTELSEDSVISMTDLVARDIAHKMAFAEDVNSFLGDGTATYGGITGVSAALQAGAKVTLGTAGWANLALSDLHAAVGKISQYAGIQPRWFMSSYAYQVAVLPLLTALGGTDMRQFEEGGEMMLLGYPVTFTQVLPKATVALSDLLILFGDLDLGAYSGQRRQLTIRVLNELYAAQDSIGIQSTMRADSVTHSVGDATQAGAIVGIYNAAA